MTAEMNKFEVCILNALRMLVMVGVSSSFAVCLCPRVAGQNASTRPNILFIISDDLSAGALGCYGNDSVLTPNLDRLAMSGVKFDRAYCQYPVCGAARAALMASMYSPSINIMGNGGAGRFDANIGTHRSWAEHFRLEGYHSARVGKIYHMRVPGDITAGVDGPDHADSWSERVNCPGPEWMSYGRWNHITNEKLNMNPGKHYGLGFGTAFFAVEGRTDGSEQPDYLAADHAIRIMQENRDHPFFLAVGFVRPHVPLVAPKAWFDRYESGRLPVAEVPEGDWDDIPKAGISMNSRSIGLENNTQKKQEVLEAYYASVSFMDEQVGRVVQSLDQLGLRENTIVIFTSDHGYHLGEHDLWQKVSLHEESVRVPLIICGPGVEKGIRNDLVQHVDLYPTMSAMAGLGIPNACQGMNIEAALKGGELTDRHSIHSCTGRGHLWRTDRFAYIEYNDGSRELYDMQKDPQQYTNLASNPDGSVGRIINELSSDLHDFLDGLPELGRQ